MKVTNEKTENSQVFLSVEMDAAEMEEALKKSYHRLVKKANIPGFRKGKAPRDVLEGYLGKESLIEDAINKLVPEAYEKAIKEQEIDAFAQPDIEITQTDPVIFKATVPLRPTVTLGDYHSVNLTPEPVELTEDKVNSVIDRLHHQQATWEPVERPVAYDDLAVLDVESKIEEEPFLNREGFQYWVRRDSQLPVPGFVEQLLEMQKGEDKEFKLQIPSDYPKSELAGKKPWFKVKVVEIKEEKLPELNDELAKQINPEFETVAVMREKISAELQKQAEEKVKVDFEEKVLQEVVNLTQVEFPPVLVEMETDRLMNEQARRLQMSGHGLEEYLGSVNKTVAELREDLKPQATQRITNSLVLEKVSEEEKIEVSDADIDAEIEEMLKDAGESKDELQKYLNTPQSKESIKQMLTTRKTIQHLVAIAKEQS